jgi:hypothetical protein
MTRNQVKAMVLRAARATRIIQDADPQDKAAVYRGLNLVLTYQPTSRTIYGNAQLTADADGLMVGVRGGAHP